MSTPPSLADIMTAILNAVTSIISAIVTVISDNATTIGTILVVGVIVTAVMAFGRKMFTGLSGWLRGIF